MLPARTCREGGLGCPGDDARKHSRRPLGERYISTAEPTGEGAHGGTERRDPRRAAHPWRRRPSGLPPRPRRGPRPFPRGTHRAPRRLPRRAVRPLGPARRLLGGAVRAGRHRVAGPARGGRHLLRSARRARAAPSPAARVCAELDARVLPPPARDREGRAAGPAQGTAGERVRGRDRTAAPLRRPDLGSGSAARACAASSTTTSGSSTGGSPRGSRPWRTRPPRRTGPSTAPPRSSSGTASGCCAAGTPARGCTPVLVRGGHGVSVRGSPDLVRVVDTAIGGERVERA